MTYSDGWLSFQTTFIFFKERPFLYFFLALFLITFMARIIFDVFTPYSLRTELMQKRNRAVGLSFAGYIAGAGIIIQGILGSGPALANFPADAAGRKLLLWDIADTLAWSFLGIVLLGVAWWINDKLILRQLDNQKELTDHRNNAVALTEIGSYLGSAFIIRGSLAGEGAPFPIELLGTLIFFFSGQIILLIFCRIYQGLTFYDTYREISEKNDAVGLSLGVNMVSFGWALGRYSASYNSLAGLLAWGVLFILVWMGVRFIVDKVLLPWDSLDKEIGTERNRNAALAESAVMLVSSLWLSTLFL